MTNTSTRIEWTQTSWNPVTGCTRVSSGCDHCYADAIATRFAGTPAFPNGFTLTLRPERLTDPLRWRTPRRVFVNSMSDLFHDNVPDRHIADVFAVMALTRQHTYQLLTKRHARIRSLLSRPDFLRQVAEAASELIGSGVRTKGMGTGWTATPGPHGHIWTPPWPLPNVWVGVSVENQHWADIRVPALLDTPAAIRWLSCEPLLGPIELRTDWLRPIPGCAFANPDDGLCAHPQAATPECHRHSDCPPNPDTYRGINWVVVGGESGPAARPMHPFWAWSLRDQCESVSVPFFFKQWGTWAPLAPSRGNPGATLILLLPDGTRYLRANGQLEPPTVAYLARYGKTRAGRLLDSRTWDQYPTGCDGDLP
ncbi:DUF5131 family protein [Phytohabitans sp. LJ34]|uniref:DUF5131 family protein n=1 Tax=Phytohabitans sp. LJ34 TaxID=3452217 RepID=UPI003F8C2BAB